MINITSTYQNPSQYREDIIFFAKACLARYINMEIDKGSENSTRLHLYQDTLLKKEVENFLGLSNIKESDIAVLEKQIMFKAQDSIKSGMFLPLEYLIRKFELNRFERFVITILTASELEPDFGKVYTYINNDWKSNDLSVEIAIGIYFGTEISYEEIISTLSQTSTICKYLISYDKNCGIHQLKRMLTIKPAARSFLNGYDIDAKSLNGITEYFYPQEELDQVLLQDKPFLHIMKYLSGKRKDSTTILYLYGPDGIGKKLNIKYLAKECNQSVTFINLEKLDLYIRDMNYRESLYPLLQEVLTDVIIKQSFLCISSTSSLLSENESLCDLLFIILEYVKKELSIIFLTSDCQEKINFSFLNTDVIATEITAGSAEESHSFWTGMAEGYHFDSDVLLDAFADKFELTPGQIKAIYQEAQNLARWLGKGTISLQLLQKVCFDKMEHNLGKKAQKVNMIYQWEDLILPDYNKNLLKAASDQMKYRYKVFTEWGYREKMAYGTGLSLLLCGPPGTGKTMAAQVLAGEIGMELYKIDLSSIVSKYIGETEQNLNEVFKEARLSRAILFFDEADALFGKRTEVKDAHDRYSNIEAAYLLQKIEEYSGIVILASNYQQNIDEAFKRRIKFLIDFPFPDKEHRKKLWKKVFPDKLPLSADVDYDFLAVHFELSGSNIRNIALNAAFLAASEDNKVGMRHIIASVVNEFTKSGKKLTREDLGEYYMYV